MDAKKKVFAMMSGIQPYRPGDHPLPTFANVSTNNLDPPAYMVAFVFLDILGFENRGGEEKVLWHTYFEYKDHLFKIRDYKFGSWSLEATGDLDTARALVPEIVGKVQAASHRADKLLRSEFKELITNDEFFINNAYIKLRTIYEFHAAEVQSALDQLVSLEARQDSMVRAHRINETLHLEKNIVCRATPMMVSFFSLLEFVLDVFYAFEQPDIPFLGFRGLDWASRFKKVATLEPRTEMTRFYEDFVNIKKKYRNPLTHGLTGESSLLVPFPFAGLVPISYKYLTQTIHFGLTEISPDSAREMLDAFTKFLDFIARTEPYSYYIRYAEHGFEIPIMKQMVSMIQSKMTTHEDFDSYLEARSRYQDMVVNREV